MPSQDPTASSSSRTVRLRVTGMTCGRCDRIIREGLGELPGVKAVRVRRESGSVEADLVEGGGSLPQTAEKDLIRTLESLAGGKKFKAKVVKDKNEKGEEMYTQIAAKVFISFWSWRVLQQVAEGCSPPFFTERCGIECFDEQTITQSEQVL